MANEHEIDDGLTNEERAALAEPDEANDDNPEGDDADQTLDETDGAAGTADAAGDGSGNTDAAAAAAAADTQAAGTAAEQPVGTPQQAAPILIAAAPEDAEAKLADIATKKDELLSQFDDGDITAKEYQQQLDVLGKQEREIERAVDRAQLAGEMETQRVRNEFIATAVNFTQKVHPEYSANPDLYKQLDETVIMLANMPSMSSLTGVQILEKAHKIVAVDHPDVFAATAKDDVLTPTPTTRQQPVIPPTLGRVPAADINDAAGGKYAALDRLADADPGAFEDALAKLPDAEREAYMASA